MQEVRVQVPVILHVEVPAECLDEASADVVTQHDGGQQIGATGALPLRHSDGGMDQRSPGMATDDMRAAYSSACSAVPLASAARGCRDT